VWYHHTTNRYVGSIMIKKIFVGSFIVSLLCYYYATRAAKETTMKITSPAFLNNGAIQKEYSCDGQDHSPMLSWESIPKETKSLVLIVDDPDAQKVTGKIWVHWLLANIPATVTSLASGYSAHHLVPFAIEGLTDFGTVGYGGPCPPSGTHQYYFKLYALDTTITVDQGFTKKEVLEKMQGHILAQTECVGSYERSSR
jgi:Raf kinase inhibitor-like YbhB/YbcL family protein